MARTVPVMATEVPGNFVTGALWNAQVGGLGNFALNVPRFRGYQTAAQSILDNTWVSLLIDTEEFDTEGGHSITTNTSRYTCQVAGTYLVSGAVGFVTNTTGNRAVRLALNGSAIHGTFVKTLPAAGGSSGLTTVGYAVMAVGDYVEVQGNQNSGTASPGLSTNNSTDVGCALACHWISSS